MESVQIVAEFAGKNWGAFSPNLKGVYVVADSLNELVQEFVDAARFHVDGLAEDGEPIPAVDLNTYVVSPVVYLDSLGELRKSLGIKQGDVAKELNTSQPRVSSLERNPETVSYGVMRQYLALIEKVAGVPGISLIDRQVAS